MKPTIKHEDFTKLDLRVGKVLETQLVEGSSRLMRLKVDLGEGYGIKTIIGGLAGTYTAEDLTDKQFVFLANLEPKKLMGEESCGMIMAAGKDGKFELLAVSEKVETGTEIC